MWYTTLFFSFSFSPILQRSKLLLSLNLSDTIKAKGKIGSHPSSFVYDVLNCKMNVFLLGCSIFCCCHTLITKHMRCILHFFFLIRTLQELKKTMPYFSLCIVFNSCNVQDFITYVVHF